MRDLYELTRLRSRFPEGYFEPVELPAMSASLERLAGLTLHIVVSVNEFRLKPRFLTHPEDEIVELRDEIGLQLVKGWNEYLAMREHNRRIVESIPPLGEWARPFYQPQK